ncbi:hypothetical protein XENOCAPTIV_017839, partial [Xenoophorus captivus]
LKGILPLVGLLHSPNTQVKLTASAALRNLSFKSDRNKEEIHRCNGIPEAAAQLKDSDSVELDKQLTGLLWNLSCADNLKPDLLKNALSVLTERVILPYTTSPSNTVKDPVVFFHATGCLRKGGVKFASLQTSLPQLLGLLKEGTSGANESDDTLAIACQAASSLVLKNIDLTKSYLSSNLIQSLNSISQNM